MLANLIEFVSNHYVLSSLFVVLLVLLVITEARKGGKSLTSRELTTMVNGGQGVVLDIVLGVIGAVVGGFIFNQLGAVGVTGFNIWSMFVAVIGAVVVLLIYHAVAGRSTSV